MKTVIAGGREFTDRVFFIESIKTIDFKITEVVCGMARGADTLGEKWAIANKIPVKYFPADWNKFKNAAGPIRNTEMAKYCDAVIAFWDGNSSGTRNMISLAEKYNRKLVVFRY